MLRASLHRVVRRSCKSQTLQPSLSDCWTEPFAQPAPIKTFTRVSLGNIGIGRAGCCMRFCSAAPIDLHQEVIRKLSVELAGHRDRRGQSFRPEDIEVITAYAENVLKDHLGQGVVDGDLQV